MKKEKHTVSNLLNRIKKGEGSIPKTVIVGTLKTSLGVYHNKEKDIDAVSKEKALKSIKTLINTVSIVKHKSSSRIAYTIFEYMTKHHPDYLDDDDYRILVNNFISNGTYVKSAFSYWQSDAATKAHKETQARILTRVIEEDKLKQKTLDTLLNKKGGLVDRSVYTYESEAKKQSFIGLSCIAIAKYPEWFVTTVLKYDNGMERLVNYIDILLNAENRQSSLYGQKNVFLNSKTLATELNLNEGIDKICETLIEGDISKNNGICVFLDYIEKCTKVRSYQRDVSMNHTFGQWVVSVYKHGKKVKSFKADDKKPNVYFDSFLYEKYARILNRSGYSLKLSSDIKINVNI